MPKYFFDIHANGHVTRDDEGLDIIGLKAVRDEAMKVLPAIAKDEVLDDGDRQSFAVHVRNADGDSIYVAALSVTGVWLLGE